MPARTLSNASKGLRNGFLIAGIVGLVTCVMAWFQFEQERRIDLEDLDRRAHVLAHQISDSVLSALALPESKAKEELASDLQGYRRLIGFAVYLPDGRLLSSGKGVMEFSDVLQEPVKRALQTGDEITELLRSHDSSIHVLAYPVRDSAGQIKGVLVALHETSHLEIRASNRLMRFAFWIIIVTLLLTTLVVGTNWVVYERPLQNLADWMQRLRTGSVNESATSWPACRTPCQRK